MISTFILTLMLSIEEPKEFIKPLIETEAVRRRGKGPKGRRRGGSGLR